MRENVLLHPGGSPWQKAITPSTLTNTRRRVAHAHWMNISAAAAAAAAVAAARLMDALQVSPSNLSCLTIPPFGASTH
jgi:hypothetical protein